MADIKVEIRSPTIKANVYRATLPGGTNTEEYDGEHIVTPSSTEQKLETANKLLKDDITVKAIPSEYVIPEGSIEITENGEYDVTEKARVNVDIKTDDTALVTLIDLIENDVSGDFVVPEGTTKIAQYRFQENNNLTGVVFPDSVVDIGHSSFRFCNSIKNITIPKDVMYLAQYTFANCSNLNSVYFTGKAVVTMYPNTFQSSDKLKDIYVPWAEGAVPNAPWGAVNAAVHYNWDGTKPEVAE